MTTKTGKTKLATLAGADKLRGVVCVTDTMGVSHHYEDEAAAEAAWGGRVTDLEHRRGAFFEIAKRSAPKPPPPPPTPGSSKSSSSSSSSSGSGKRRKQSSD